MRGQAFNFSTESWVPVSQIVQTLRKLIDSELEPHILDPARSEISSQSRSAEKARRLLSWEADWDLEHGLAETIDWYRAYLPADVAG